ncbi:DNA repair protein, partial [Pseudogemmobacter humi]|uniref:DNA repair protein n=1 Tax=Pseudogemmobacter humi TaxID=2483812 RepID=UPI000F538553
MFPRERGWRRLHEAGRAAAQLFVILVAVSLVFATACAVLGWLPWPELALSFGGEALPQAGMWLQIGLTLAALSLLFWLPANARMARLESAHRSFAMGIEDVSRAYRLAHATDRAGVFALSSEFESVRARMEHLRQHPDFAHLEPELLQLAAQMSHETRELARAYSDVKVARAKTFLHQRQEEVAALTDRLALARATCDELRRWLTDIEAEERQTQVQLKRLEADLREILPGLGYSVDFEDRMEGNVVTLPKPAPERAAERSP